MLTLILITLMNYAILYVLLSISISLFVPVSLFNNWTSANPDFTFQNYLKLLWFVASLGLLGAMGSTVEDEEKIRRITYSYRQYHRYKEAEQEQEEEEDKQQSASQDESQQEVEQSASSKEDNDDEQHEGKKQDHREEDES